MPTTSMRTRGELRGAASSSRCLSLAMLLAVCLCFHGLQVMAQGVPSKFEFSGLDTKPVAFFPLLGRELGSVYPDNSYSGKIVGGQLGVVWEDDRSGMFPNAMKCETGSKGLVELDTVPYGSTNGDFSINFWMKKGPLQFKMPADELEEDDGDGPSVTLNDYVGSFEYIFSHTSTQGDPKISGSKSFSPWTPNQIHMYLPAIVHPAHGVVRAIVKDSDDVYQGLKSQTWLDSDGRYMDNNPRDIPGHVNIEDQAWHMVTLTSEGKGKKGYRMYIDGVLAGEAPPSIILDQLEEGVTEIPMVQVDGGDPLNLNSSIHLCGRVDEHPERHFSGNIAHLSLWDTVLTNKQIADMYSAKMGEEKLKQRCVESSSSELAAIDKIDLCPFLKSGSSDRSATNIDYASNIGTLSDTLDALSNNVASPGKESMGIPKEIKAEEAKPCSVLQKPSDCGKGFLCFPTKIYESFNGNKNSQASSDEGKCVREPVGGIFPPDPSVDVPMPVAFFPLTGGSVESWPIETYKGEAKNVDWAPDILFENALKCSEQQGGYVEIPNVKYGTNGSFAVNFWMRKDSEENDFQENGFEYIYSHGNMQGDNYNPFGPNNVHVYLPEIAHPAHGVARVIVKDSASDYKGMMSHTFFDSDGKFMDNSPRNTIGHVNLEDGNWHMFTLTTKASGEAGYEIYVDGSLGGSFPTPEIESFLTTSTSLQPTRNGLPLFQVDGGEPLKMEGNIFLCGRGDLESDRHFDGSLSHLDIFDESLTPEAIGALYRAVKGQSLLLESIVDLANSVRALQPTRNSGARYFNTLTSADIINALKESVEKGLSSNSCTIDVKKSGLVTPVGCEQDGLVCAALHDKDGPDNGVCVATPAGGIYAPEPGMELPVPKAYFPLTGGSLESWPDSAYSGEALSRGSLQGVSWVDDDFFGNVLQCKENNLDYVTLDNVEYGKDGSFAVNIWMAHNSSTGDAFEFLFSHGNKNIGQDPWSPNEVQIYLPEIAHPAHGVVRTIVKDSNDKYVGEESQTYLDSDGGFMNNMPRNVPGHANLEDGKWHMITVTTNPDGSKGYSVYVDGILGGTAPPAFMRELANAAISVDGGDAILPDGPMFLCGRNDKHPDRHFGGRLAHLSLFDEALSGRQVMSMYVAAAGETAGLQRTMALILSQIPQDQRRDGNNLLRTLNRAQVGEACYVKTDPSLEQNLYSNTLSNRMCVDGAICAPKANSPTMPSSGSGSFDMFSGGLHGQCVEVTGADILPELESHDGQMYFPNPLMNVPTPFAFFPLTSGKVSSWPSSIYKGDSYGTTWVEDETFGQVLSCDDDSYLALDPVPYSADGPFAVNFWFRNNDSVGTSFEYVFSHSGDDDIAFGPFYPNQLHIYLPEESHPAHGVIRTIVKDSSDAYEGSSSETYLDSDGFVNNNKARDTPGHVDVNDNEWHMITVTTRADGGKGYAIFVDGVLGGANFLPVNEEEALNGKPFNVDGGDPLLLNGHIFLCGRNDMHPERHFKGKLSHLTLFNTALSPSEVAALFVSVKGEDAFTKRLQELAAGQDPRLVENIPPITETEILTLKDKLKDLQTSGGAGGDAKIDRLSQALQNLQGQTISTKDIDTLTDKLKDLQASGSAGDTNKINQLSQALQNLQGQEISPQDILSLKGKLSDLQDNSKIDQLSQTLENLQRQKSPASSVSQQNTQLETTADKAASEAKSNKKATQAGILGLFLGLVIAVVVGGLVYGAVALYRKKKAARPGHGDKMLALPTRSPAVSRNVSNVCVDSPSPAPTPEPDNTEIHENKIFSGNALAEQVKSAQIKSQHKKMSKYENFEDEG